jgi:hypothetical protein
VKRENLPDPAQIFAIDTPTHRVWGEWVESKAAAPAEEEHRDGRKTGGAALDADQSIVTYYFSPPGQPHPTSAKFYKVLQEAAALHAKKQRDYGTGEDPFANVRASEDFGIPAWLGCMVRSNDKIRRMMSFAKKGELANESIEDALIDLLVYAGIGLVLYREHIAGPPDA